MKPLHIEGNLSLDYGYLHVSSAEKKDYLGSLFGKHFFPGRESPSTPTIWRIEGNDIETGRMRVTFESLDTAVPPLSIEGVCGFDDDHHELYIEGGRSGFIDTLVIDHFWRDDFPCKYDNLDDCEIDLGRFRILFEPVD
jgi:hypothetical protein